MYQTNGEGGTGIADGAETDAFCLRLHRRTAILPQDMRRIPCSAAEGFAVANSLQHPILGFLEWDEKLAWWVGCTDLRPDYPVEIFISGEGDPPEAVLMHVPDWLERIRNRELQYRRWTAEQVESDRWNSEEAMTVEDITHLLRLASINFDSDGEASLYWDDQDRLYWGHNLVSDIDTNGEPIRARMEG